MPNGYWKNGSESTSRNKLSSIPDQAHPPARQAGGEVTATMKVRRSSIYKAYESEIEALFR
jgi:long-subunit acyl-CoA synthetase (AMP-forming)